MHREHGGLDWFPGALLIGYPQTCPLSPWTKALITGAERPLRLCGRGTENVSGHTFLFFFACLPSSRVHKSENKSHNVHWWVGLNPGGFC